MGINIGPFDTGLSCVADALYLMTDDQTKLQGLDIAQHYGQQYTELVRQSYLLWAASKI